MSDNEVLSVEVAKHLYEVYGTDEESDGDRAFAVLYESHEALRVERDAFRVGDEIARRHADGWHPEFAPDPNDSKWVPWDDGEPEPMTAEQYEWYRAAWADRHARKAKQ